MRAVVFDCDGVLVDSEPISERAWSLVLGRHGYSPSPGDHAATRGTSGADTAAYYRRLLELDPSHDLLAETDGGLHGLLATELVAFPDALVTIRELAAEGVPMGVASSSSRANLDLKLRKFDLGRYLDVTVAGDEVPRGKPAPDPYLAAASGLGLEPGECLAIDDTEVGADAAVAAGMRTVQLLRDGSLCGRHTTTSALDAALILHWLGRR